MYIIDITIGVTVTDTNRVTTYAIAIALPSDEVIKNSAKLCSYVVPS